jgi:ABC-type uncharacterized transport system permease subunit
MFNLDINKVPFNTAANIGFSVLGGMLAPFFYLFQFAKPIFDKYEWQTQNQNIKMVVWNI